MVGFLLSYFELRYIFPKSFAVDTSSAVFFVDLPLNEEEEEFTQRTQTTSIQEKVPHFLCLVTCCPLVHPAEPIKVGWTDPSVSLLPWTKAPLCSKKMAADRERDSFLKTLTIWKDLSQWENSSFKSDGRIFRAVMVFRWKITWNTSETYLFRKLVMHTTP